jgi:hypothetical protein
MVALLVLALVPVLLVVHLYFQLSLHQVAVVAESRVALNLMME